MLCVWVMVVLVWILFLMYLVLYVVSGRKYIFYFGKFFCFNEVEFIFEVDVIYICFCILFVVFLFCYFNVFRYLRINVKCVKNMCGVIVIIGDRICYILLEEI